VAGTVVAVGADVTRFQVGDDVFGIARGSFADYAAAQEDKLVPKPARLSFEQAAVAAVSGLAAIKGLHARRIAAGQKVLIIGASGGVGTYAVQLAKGLRGHGHWRSQHRENRSGPLDRRRRGHRLHAGGLCRRPPVLRSDPRHRW
jgi:NADPH:quinone reductase-like Zn-dependent oxidoreductase